MPKSSTAILTPSSLTAWSRRAVASALRIRAVSVTSMIMRWRRGHMSTADILAAINAEDQTVPEAVRRALPELVKAVDAATEALRGGHRVHYVGAGTSGRLAVLDAAELVPTYNVPDDWFVAHHAGGQQALRSAVENAEDDAEAGAAELRARCRPGISCWG